jgi:hypothetical protein
VKGKLAKVIVDKLMNKGFYTEKWDTKQDDNKPRFFIRNIQMVEKVT